MNQKAAAPNLFERIAKASYEATRVWLETEGEPKKAQWDDLEQWRQKSVVEGIKRALEGGTPEQVHELWRDNRIKRGWSHGEVRDEQAKQDPYLKPYAQLTDRQRRKPDLFAAVAHTLYKCGKERWNIKTMTDPAAGQVNVDEPQPVTIAELAGLEAPVEPVERQPGEMTAYQLKGTLTVAKLEADKDVHMVVSENGNTMIVESVSPECAETSRVLDQISAVRQAVEQRFPQVAAGGREEGLEMPVTVTGVAFFDRLHGAEGAAPNGIELHPVLSISFEGAEAA